MAEVATQIESGVLTLGEITDAAQLHRSLRDNAIPDGLDEVTAGSYQEFLGTRRALMAAVIQRYFDQL